jgi:hypothetical protein
MAMVLDIVIGFGSIHALEIKDALLCKVEH